jgi:hypothetical protein
MSPIRLMLKNENKMGEASARNASDVQSIQKILLFSFLAC